MTATATKQPYRPALLSCTALMLSACGGGGGDPEPVNPPPPPPPAPVSISIADAAIDEGDSGAVELVFLVTLDSAAADTVGADYASSDNGATAGNDYTATSGRLTITAGSLTTELRVSVLGDTDPEGDEAFTLTLSNPSSNATITDGIADGLIRDDDDIAMPAIGRLLNDTGVTGCANSANNDSPCASAAAGTDVYPGQDAEFGRDVDANSDVDGKAGFAFTKLDDAGEALTDQSRPYTDVAWACVRDNVTGLTWETKTTDGGLQDAGWTYSWFDSTAVDLTSEAGDANGGQCDEDGQCDTERLVTRVNAASLCGYTDWRVPNRSELASVLNYGRVGSAMFDPDYFPNGPARVFWTGTPSFFGGAWVIDAESGDSESDWSFEDHSVRLVRGGF